MKVKVLPNQNLFDIAIQHTGDENNALIIAIANKLSITQPLASIMEIEIPVSIKKNIEVIKYYTARELYPATGIRKRKKTDLPVSFVYECVIEL